MSNRFRSVLAASLEENNDETQLPRQEISDSTATEKAEEEGNLEESVIDQREAESRLDEAVEHQEELEEATAGLESIYDELMTIQKQGKIDRSTVMMAKLAIESYTCRVGIDDDVTISTEAFSSSATTTSLGETLGKMVEAVWNAILAVKDMIWNFLKKVFTAGGRLKTRAERLSKFNPTTLKAPKGKKPLTFKVEGLAEKIAVGKTVPTDYLAAVAKLKGILEGCIQWDKKAQEMADKTRELFLKYIDNKINLDFLRNTDVRKLEGPRGFKKISNSSVWGYETEVLPGNTVFSAKLEVSGNAVKIDNTSRFFGVKVTKEVRPVSLPAETEVAAIKPEQIPEIGREIVALVNQIGIVEDAVSKSKKRLKSFGKPRAFTSAGRKEKSDVLRVFKMMESLPNQLSAKVCGYTIQIATIYLGIAERSIGQYATSNESYSQEAFSGAIGGFFGTLGYMSLGSLAGMLVGMPGIGAAVGAAYYADKKFRRAEKLTQEIRDTVDKIAYLKAGVAKGKEDPTAAQQKEIEKEQRRLLNAVTNGVLALNTALKPLLVVKASLNSSRIQDLSKELVAKQKELEEELKKQNFHSAKDAEQFKKQKN